MTTPHKTLAAKIATVVGVVLATAFVIFGLAVVAGFVLLIVGMNNYGSNK